MLGLEQLDALEREALAVAYGAPGASASVLERHLLAPFQVQRRASMLSPLAEEALHVLLESASPDLLLETLSDGAVEELRAAWMVTTAGAPARVSICDPVAVACLSVFEEVIPCRLRLMLGSDDLEPDEGATEDPHSVAIEARLAAILDVPPNRPGVAGGARILSWLSDRRVVARIIGALEPEEEKTFWDLIVAGGAVEWDWPNNRPWSRLADLGLVWETARDLRVPVEVLRASLELRLERHARTAAAEEVRALRQSGRSDVVRLFPIDPVHLLTDIVQVMLRGGPGRRWSLEELGEELGEKTLPAMLDLLSASGILDAGDDEFGLAGPPSIERGTAEWGARIIDDVTEGSAQGWSSPAVQHTLLGMLGVVTNGALLCEAPDEAERMGWAATGPGMLEVASAEYPEGAGAALGAAWLGVLLHAQLTGLQAGWCYSAEALARVCQALVKVTRIIVRLDGPLYMSEDPVPSLDLLVESMWAWLDALAVPLGWISRTPPRPSRGPQASLLDRLDGDASHGVFWDSSGGRMGHIQVVRRVPTIEPRVERPWRGLLGGLMTPSWSDQQGPASGNIRRPARLTEEIAQYRTLGEGKPGRDLALSIFETYVREQTRAYRLREISEQDVVRFFVHWMWRLTAQDGRQRVRSFFEAVHGLLRWSIDSGEPLKVDIDKVRQTFEGALLRLCSAWDAFGVYHSLVPPADLLQLQPAPAFDGLVEVQAFDPSGGWLLAWPRQDFDRSPGDGKKGRASRSVRAQLRVGTDPRPQALLRPGDLLDGQFVRYGDVCWMTVLRRLWLQQALEFVE